AERLVYKQPKEELNVTVRPDRSTYVPGQRPTLTVQARNENEESAPAIVMLAVVDKSVVTMADEKTARSMPTHFLLTSEVRKPEELEHADVLLGNHPKAAQALDLLLGTQGWRRFVEQNANEPRRSREPEAERLLVVQGRTGPGRRDVNSFQIEREKVVEAARPAVTAAQQRLAEANTALATVQADADYPSEVQRRSTALAQANAEASAARAALDETL